MVTESLSEPRLGNAKRALAEKGRFTKAANSFVE